MNSYNKSAIDVLLAQHSLRYETRQGEVVRGMSVRDLVTEMRLQGWKNVSRMNWLDFRDLGFRITAAQYVGGVRKTGRFVNVVCAP